MIASPACGQLADCRVISFIQKLKVVIQARDYPRWPLHQFPVAITDVVTPQIPALYRSTHTIRSSLETEEVDACADFLPYDTLLYDILNKALGPRYRLGYCLSTQGERYEQGIVRLRGAATLILLFVGRRRFPACCGDRNASGNIRR